MSKATNSTYPAQASVPPTMPANVPQLVVPGQRPPIPPNAPALVYSTGNSAANPSTAWLARQVATTPNSTQGAHSNPPAQRTELTREQTRLLKLTDAELIHYYLSIGNIALPPTVSEPAVKALFNDLSIAYFNGRAPDRKLIKTNAQTDALKNLLNRAGRFRQEMSESRNAVMKQLQATGETDAMPFLNKAVQECTNSVRKELYADKPYPAVRISPETLLQKARTLRDTEVRVRSQLGAQSQLGQQQRQREADIPLKQKQRAAQTAQAAAAAKLQQEQAAIAAATNFYTNCNNDNIAGSQDGQMDRLAPTNTACLKQGSFLEETG
jgi:hypothetical protein